MLLGVGATWGYAQILSARAEAQRQEFLRNFPTAVAGAPAEPPPAATVAAVAPAVTATAQPATATPVETATEEAAPPTPTFSPTPRPPDWETAPPPTRITISAIDLDTQVIVSEIEDGTWEVPKFVAGYLNGTGRPAADGGNVAISGHVQSLTSGNVFARIGELETGQQIVLYSDEGRFEYEVTEKRLVTPDDVSVTYPSADPKVTLITCTGDWDPIQRDYTQRLIIFGKLVAVNGQPANAT